jgi:hypothetical protein
MENKECSKKENVYEVSSPFLKPLCISRTLEFWFFLLLKFVIDEIDQQTVIDEIDQQTLPCVTIEKIGRLQKGAEVYSQRNITFVMFLWATFSNGKKLERSFSQNYGKLFYLRDLPA